MSIEKTVIEHYEREKLAESILEQARQKARNPDKLTTGDLAHLDDMHVGGRQGTEHLLAQLGLKPGMAVLDAGSGVGGSARFAAETYGVNVTGIDLTPGYKEAAEALSKATGLAGKTEFVTGSVLAMKFTDGAFDAAWTIHVGMNIEDKRGFYRDAHRVLKPGAVFGIYDVMAGQDNTSLDFPLPWARTRDSSFVLTPEKIAELLAAAGFTVRKMENRRDFALTQLGRLMASEAFKARTDDYPDRIRNLVSGIEKDICAPWEVIAVRI